MAAIACCEPAECPPTGVDDTTTMASQPSPDILRLAGALARLAARRQKLADQIANAEGERRCA